jgi:hypothetical protein
VPLRSPDLLEPEGRIIPLFSANESASETISSWAETGIAAVSRKECGSHTSWFCSLPPVGPGLLRRIFRESGAHIYDDHGDVLFGGGGMLCVHTLNGGPRNLVLLSGREVELHLPPRSTSILDAADGRFLIGSDDLQSVPGGERRD